MHDYCKKECPVKEKIAKENEYAEKWKPKSNVMNSESRANVPTAEVILASYLRIANLVEIQKTFVTISWHSVSLYLYSVINYSLNIDIINFNAIAFVVYIFVICYNV